MAEPCLVLLGGALTELHPFEEQIVKQNAAALLLVCGGANHRKAFWQAFIKPQLPT